jgi:pimeloyl-ACP methyl ester carboxylesterase
MLTHLSAVLLGLAALSAFSPAASQVPPGDTSTFSVLMQGVRIGNETVTLARTASGWTISSSGRQGSPIDLVTSKFEMVYAADWQPERLTIDATVRGQALTLSTTFGLTTAISDMVQGDKKGSVTHIVTARTIVLPNNFYGSYEALAARLGAAAAGAHFPVYVAPQAELTATVDRVTPRRIFHGSTASDFRQYDLTLTNPSGPVSVEVWIDSRNRLARVIIPAASLMVLRDDLSSVMSRDEAVRRDSDENVFIPSEGFNLAATVTSPPKSATRQPAVILVPGSGPQTREMLAAGVPIFGQLAGAIADASGAYVVRYDKRGSGQSGGRTESATLSEYADDVVRIVTWLSKRKDIDGDRIAVLGYGDGGAVAMLAAARDNRLRGLALVASPGRTGRDTVMEQQRQALARLTTSDADKQGKIALQSQVIEAVITGKGWESVPTAVRQGADTPWFKSWLLFDPAGVISKIDRPLLIVHAALDAEVPAADADALEALGRRRSKRPPDDTRKVVVAGVNHLLVPARSGAVEEYGALATKTISPDVTAVVATWLSSLFAAKK